MSRTRVVRSVRVLQVNLRLREPLAQRLRKSAVRNNRSFNAEMAHRLEAGLEAETMHALVKKAVLQAVRETIHKKDPK